MGVRLRHSACTTETKTALEGKRSSGTLMTLTFLQAGTGPCDAVSPEPQFLQLGKQSPRESTRTPNPHPRIAFPRPLTHTTGIVGGSVGINHRESMTEKENRLAGIRTRGLGRPSSYPSCLSSNRNPWFCSPAEASRGSALTKELGEVQISPIQILKQAISLALEPSLLKPRQGAASEPPYCGGCLLPQSDQNHRQQLLEAMGSRASPLER